MVHPLSPPGTILIHSKIGCKYNRRSGTVGGVTNPRYIHTVIVNNMHTYIHLLRSWSVDSTSCGTCVIREDVKVMNRGTYMYLPLEE